MMLRQTQRGFTFPMVLSIMVVMGIMLGMVGQSWKTAKQRDYEEELVFRGDQVADLLYQKILCSSPVKGNLTPAQVIPLLWTAASPKGTVLDDLVGGMEVRCVNGTVKKFRLRPSATVDPFTNKQFLIVNPVGNNNLFSGVSSSAPGIPFKKSFKDIYDSVLLDEKKLYSEWQFTWELKQPIIQTVK